MIQKAISTLILSVFLTMGYAQKQTDKLLAEYVAALDTAYTANSLQELANDFERIALADEDSWLAQYYTSYSYVQLACQAKGEQIDVYCNQAELHLKNAEKLQPKNSEIYALYAYLYGAKVNVDPIARGAEMGRKSANYIALSIQVNPKNPRPYLIRAMGVYYTPKAFGGGVEKSVPLLEQALEKFKTFQPEPAHAPHWGKESAEQLLQNSIKQ